MRRIKRRHKALIRMRRTIRTIYFDEYVRKRWGSWERMISRYDE